MIHLPGFPLLKLDIFCQVDQEGKRQKFVVGLATIMVDSSFFSLQLEGGQDIIRNLELVSRMKLAEEDEIVKKVFRQITKIEHNWINLYKVCEIVKKDYGKKIRLNSG